MALINLSAGKTLMEVGFSFCGFLCFRILRTNEVSTVPFVVFMFRSYEMKKLLLLILLSSSCQQTKPVQVDPGIPALSVEQQTRAVRFLNNLRLYYQIQNLRTLEQREDMRLFELEILRKLED